MSSGARSSQGRSVVLDVAALQPFGRHSGYKAGDMQSNAWEGAVKGAVAIPIYSILSGTKSMMLCVFRISWTRIMEPFY